MDKKENDKRSVLMNVASMLIFGTIGIFRRYIPLSSAFLAFSRGIVGGAFIFSYDKLRRGRASSRLPAGTFVLLAVSGALIGINWILLFEAYNHTTVAIATLCYYMQPTIVVLLSPFVFKEKLTLKKGLCAAVAVVGMVFVSGVIGGEGQKGDIKGVLLGLGAAVFYSAVVVMNKKLEGVDAYRKTTVQLFFAGAVMAPYLLFTGGFTQVSFGVKTLILLLIVGLVHTGVAYALYFGSMDGLRAQSVAILSYIDPVAALLFSAVFLKEPLSAPGIAGAVMIIGSALVSEIQTGKKTDPA